MKKGLIEVVCILDRSGSMNRIIDDCIGGINTFLEKQRSIETGEVKLTLALFDDQYELVYNNKRLKEVPPITREIYSPRGMTALHDAVCKTIDTVGSRLCKTPEARRPEKVIVVVVTDGEENYSREHTLDDVFNKITHQTEKYSWEFLFLAANQDAFARGTSLGFKGNAVLNFSYCGAGGQAAYTTISNYVSTTRSVDNISNFVPDALSSYVDDKDKKDIW